jgi:hypothetical protein
MRPYQRILKTHKAALELCYTRSRAAGHQGAVLVLDTGDYRLAPLINSLGKEQAESRSLGVTKFEEVHFGVYGLSQDQLLKVAKLMKIKTIIQSLQSPPPAGKFFVLFAIDGAANLETLEVPQLDAVENQSGH